jgi:hypothetical protein
MVMEIRGGYKAVERLSTIEAVLKAIAGSLFSTIT